MFDQRWNCRLHNGPCDKQVHVLFREQAPAWIVIRGDDTGRYIATATSGDGVFEYWWVPRERSPFS